MRKLTVRDVQWRDESPETEWTQPREWAGDMSNMAMPALVIKDFNMSTVSPGS